MARFQNGLHLNNKSGKQFSRWMFEFATQILGWDGYDNNDAGWDSVRGSGTDAATHVSDPSILDFSGDAYTLDSDDIGRIVTMKGNAGWSAAEKETIGMYKIIRVDVTNEYAYLDIKRGVHEDGLPLSKSSVSWRIWDVDDGDVPANNTWAVIRSQYLHTPSEPNMDVLITEGGGDGQTPLVAIGPFGTWDGVANAWDDSRNTANLDAWTTNGYNRYVFAYGDETNNDHFVVCVFDVANNEFLMYYIGAITPTAGTGIDTNPGVILAGHNDGAQVSLGYNAAFSSLENCGRMMAYNSGGDDVEVFAYLLVPSVYPTINPNPNLFSGNRMWSQWSGKVYRVEIMLHSRTTLHQEARGIPKSIWLSGRYDNLTPFGTDPDFFLHFQGGVSMPWNGSKVHVQWNR